jgi:hypothetical protein
MMYFLPIFEILRTLLKGASGASNADLASYQARHLNLISPTIDEHITDLKLVNNFFRTCEMVSITSVLIAFADVRKIYDEIRT